MLVQFYIAKARVLRRKYGPDRVTLVTDLPAPMPQPGEEALEFSFEVPRGQGRDFLARRWPSVPVEEFSEGARLASFSKPIGG